MKTRIWVSSTRLISFTLFACASIRSMAAAPSPIDGFAPNPNGEVSVLAILPDGKLLSSGNFTTICGTSKSFARLNPDGSLDTTFNATWDSGDDCTAVAVQANGKILKAGYSSATTHQKIMRLNANGSQDLSFDANLNGIIRNMVVQTDGKILVSGDFTTVNGTSISNFVRLNEDGSLDATFNVNTEYQVWAIAIQADGKILIGGSFSHVNGAARNHVARLNPNGSLDTQFDPGSSISSTAILDFAFQPDGKIVIGGLYTIQRVNADGTLDNTFASSSTGVMSIALQPDGKMVLGTYGTPIVRLNPNGSTDATFLAPTPDSNPDSMHIYKILVQPDGKIVCGNNCVFSGISRQYLVRLHPDGSPDTTFNATGSGANGNLAAIALDLNGKLAIGGYFTTINGTSRNRIARLKTDGMLDTTFDPGTGSPSQILTVNQQTDGNILAGGSFINFNQTVHQGLVHLNSDGGVDSNFIGSTWASSRIGWVYTMLTQKDGQILISGDFERVNSTNRRGIARLNSDGSLDTTFVPCTTTNSAVDAMALQNDGKILLSGNLYGVASKTCIARLNSDGSQDTTFTPVITGPDTDPFVFSIAVQPDGKILVGGIFSTLNGTACSRIARLLPDGSIDTTFDIGTGPNSDVFTITLQSDGKVLLGGLFTQFNGATRNHLARLNANGSLDTSFNPGTGPNSLVSLITLQPDGKCVISGGFTSINGESRNYYARLSNPDAALQNLSVASLGHMVTWTMSGSYPQMNQVLFEDSTDGVNWNTLGWGTPVPGVGFRLSDISLPINTNHYVRATGWITNGIHNSSGSIYRSVALLNTSSIPGAWVKFDFIGEEFGTQANPFNTIGEGVNAVNSADTVHIFAGSTPDAIRITKPMKIESYGGTARIGRAN